MWYDGNYNCVKRAELSLIDRGNILHSKDQAYRTDWLMVEARCTGVMGYMGWLLDERFSQARD